MPACRSRFPFRDAKTCLSATILALAAAACDCGGSRIGMASTGVTLVDPAGAPEDFERTLDLGTVRVGALAAHKLVFRNDGTLRAQIKSAVLTPSGGDFFLTGAANLPALEARQTWEPELRWVPSAPGNATATLVVETDIAETAKYTIHILGKAAAVHLDVCSTNDAGAEVCASTQPDWKLVVNMGALAPGNSTKKALVLKNLGEVPLDVSRIAPTELTSPEFTIAPDNGPVAVAAAGSVPYEVHYEAADGGSDDGFIQIDSTDPDRPRFLVEVVAEGIAPRVCVTPGVNIEFGDQALGHTAHQTLTLTSCGREPLQINALSIPPTPPRDGVFGMASPPSLPRSLAPGDKLDLDLTYTPAALAEDFGQVNVLTNDPGSPRGRINLHGRGAGCSLVVTPATVSFGLVTVNGQTAKTVQISNRGTGDCTISEVRPPAAPFHLDTAPIPPVVVGAGQIQSMIVSFRPTAQGQASDKVVLVANDARGTIDVPLTGQGGAAPPCDLQANPTSLVYTGVGTGQTATLNVMLTNYGTDDCNIGEGKVTPSTEPFKVTLGGFPPQSIASGGTLRVPVQFAPLTAGQHEATLRITFCEEVIFMGQCMGGTIRSLDIALHGGTLEPALCVSPDHLDFGNVAAGTQADQSFTITSCGQGALGIRGITMQTGTSVDYSFAQPRVRTPQFLAPSQSLQVKVLYKPRTSGADFGAVELLTNDPHTPRFLVKLRANAGNVCDKQLACAFDKLQFPTMEIGRASSLSVVCQNVGTQPVTVTGVDYAPGTSPEYKAVVGRVPQVVAPGDTVRLSVTYTPQDAGSDTGAVLVRADTCTPARVDVEGAGMQPHYPPCPPPQVFQPQVKWEWTGGTTRPQSKNVMVTPLVANLTDDNGDGRVDESDVPDVIFSSCQASECCINCLNVQDMKMMDPSGKSSLRAVSGRDGRELWTVTDAALQLVGDGNLALGDLDGDNLVDIVAPKYCFQPGTGDDGMKGKYRAGTLLVFDNRGQLKFETEMWKGSEDNIEMGSAPTIGDIDGDGNPEIAFEGTIFRSNGQKLFDLAHGGGDDGHGAFPLLTDLDGDGFQEIVTGKYAYRKDGSVIWERQPTNPATCDESATTPGPTCVCNPGRIDLGWLVKQPCAMNGLTMLLDVEKDGRAELVLRDAPTSMRILDASTGQPKYGPWSWSLPSGDDNGICSAAMSAADVDGDGKPEIIVPSGDKLLVFKHDGTQLWSAPINDYGGQCGASGSAAFDFNGQGRYDVVYGDTQNTWVFRGADGTIVFHGERNSSTLFETPVVADVDNDGHADIMMTNENGILGIGQVAGIRVFSNQGNTWPATRRIWNQHSYHITDVNENGTIPRVETPNWKADNNWRANPPLCHR